MNKIYLHNYNFSCEVSFESAELCDSVKNSEFWKIYTPDLYMVSEIERRDFLLSIGSSFLEVSFANNALEIPSKNISPEDVITIVDYIYEAQRNANGIYTLNSSVCTYQGSKGVILFGGSTAMGKTTLVRHMSGQDNFSMYSDDKVLLDLNGLKIINGSKYIHLNKTSLITEFSEARDYVELNDVENTGDVKISLFVYGYLTQDFSEHEIWSKEKFAWHMYEAVTKRIRGVTRRIANGLLALPSIDTQELSKKRINDVYKLCDNVQCLFIKDSPENVTNIIKDKLLNI